MMALLLVARLVALLMYHPTQVCRIMVEVQELLH